MIHLDFPLDLKDVSEDGTITGLAAAYNNVDYGGDVILPGAFTKTLKGRKALPMLLYHDQRLPIGVWSSFEDTTKGLKMTGKISKATSTGQEALALARDGALSGLSIGYRAVKERYTDEARELIEVGLHEASLVAIPMNERALISSVKDIMADGKVPTVREFEQFLRDSGCSKSLSVAIAAKAAPLLRGEPEAKADDDMRRYLELMRA
jgi:HK97 family phage prohead protease